MNSAFVPAVGKGVPGTEGASLVDLASDAAAKAAGQFMKDKGVPDAVASATSSALKTGARRMVKAALEGGTTVTYSGGSKSGSRTGKMGGSASNTLNYSPDPVVAKFSTVIPTNGYGDYFVKPTTTYTPVVLTLGMIQLPTSNSDIYDYIRNQIRILFVRAVQANTGYSVNTSALNTTDLIGYFNLVLECLQKIWWTECVIGFANNPSNHNDAITDLSEMFTSQDLVDMANLKRQMRGLPIPPYIKDFIRFFVQLFIVNDNRGSAIISICPFDFDSNGLIVDFGNLTTQMRNFDDTITMLAKACEHWIDKKLQPPFGVPIYSEGFKTFFSNSPTNFSDPSASINIRGPIVSSNPQITTYSAWTNNLDGVWFSLFSMFNSGTGFEVPSFWSLGQYTVGDISCNRICYTENGWLSHDASREGFNSIFTYQADLLRSTTTAQVTNPVGSAPVNGVSGRSVTESGYAFADFIFAIDSINKGNRNRRK